MIEGLSTERCEKRNRIVAQREEVEGAPVRFLAGVAANWPVSEAAGQMPETADDALVAINAGLPEGANALSADDVYIHYLEAASNSFIGDRYAFLSESTLRNIATDAANGFAFMNSHRTGSVSTESELPFGKTFAGQYQSGADEMGRTRQRAIVGVYMLRGIRPNGESGPSTDDLDAMIRGGQVADVSVGLMGGEKVCDVCNSTLSDCPHVPGTRRSMQDAEIEMQTQKGVPGGKASYTIDNARCGEVSAVFDGAVPGAGVKKVMAFKRAGKLNKWHLRQAQEAFGSLLGGNLSMENDLFDQISEAVESGVLSALQTQAGDRGQAPTTTQGASEMAEEKEKESASAVALTEMEAKLRAEYEAKFAAIEADKLKAEEEAKANAERVAKLEQNAQRTAFEAEVKGHTGGRAWFGDHGKHVEFLMSLAAAFGPESEQIKFYTTQQRALAAQLEESALFAEFGADGARADEGAVFELNQIAAKLQADNRSLSYEQAFSAALTANPALYDKYLAEQGGRK